MRRLMALAPEAKMLRSRLQREFLAVQRTRHPPEIRDISTYRYFALEKWGMAEEDMDLLWELLLFQRYQPTGRQGPIQFRIYDWELSSREYHEEFTCLEWAQDKLFASKWWEKATARQTQDKSSRSRSSPKVRTKPTCCGL